MIFETTYNMLCFIFFRFMRSKVKNRKLQSFNVYRVYKKHLMLKLKRWRWRRVTWRQMCHKIVTSKRQNCWAQLNIGTTLNYHQTKPRFATSLKFFYMTVIWVQMTIIFNLTHFCLGHVVAKGKDEEEASAHLSPMFLHNKVRFVPTSIFRVIIYGPDIVKFRFGYYSLVSDTF